MDSLSTTSDDERITDPISKRDMSDVKIPPFVDVCPQVVNTPQPTSVIRALNRLSEDVEILRVSKVDLYDSLCITSVHLAPTLPPHGHVVAASGRFVLLLGFTH